jgi:hypothetical protein
MTNNGKGKKGNSIGELNWPETVTNGCVIVTDRALFGRAEFGQAEMSKFSWTFV